MRGMGEKVASDKSVARIGERQHGVVAVRQLYAVGIGKDAVRWRVEAGRLHRLHQGVYAIGHRAISFQGKCMAAVLTCAGLPAAEEGRTDGPVSWDRDAVPGIDGHRRRSTVLGYWRAAVSHRSAAVLWDLLPTIDGPVDVSVPGDAGRAKRRGIHLHRSPTLLPAAVTLRSGIPVTTPARTICDLRRAVSTRRSCPVSEKELRRAIRQADVLGLPIGDEVERDRSRSDLERDFLRLCRRRRLPVPEVNVRIGRDLVDFLWRDRRLVVETDGYRYHRGRIAFDEDRERDLRLRALGFDVVRVSEKQVNEDPDDVAGAVVAALRVGADARE